MFENEKKVNKASKLVKVVLFFFYTSPTETLFLKKYVLTLIVRSQGKQESPDVSEDKVKGNIRTQVT